MSDFRTALDRRLALLRAHEAARAGDLDLAARLLDELGDLADPETAAEDVPTTTALLDLRARVHAQRGELDEADGCWARAQELVPDDPEAAEGRRTVARIQRGHGRAHPVVHTGWAAIGAAALAVTALVVVAAWVIPVGVDRLVEPHQERASAEAQRARAEARRAADAERHLRERRDARQQAREDASTRRERAVDAIAGDLEMSGVRIRREAETAHVVFDEGVFLYETVPRDSGPDLLRELGGRLAEMEVQTTVVGHSVAVPGQDTSGGSELAQRRARVAADYLAEGGGLPLTAFTLAVADQADGPFEDEARNRTVTLTVRPDVSGPAS